MVETSCAAVLRDPPKARRFLNALWLISAAALFFCFLSITVGWLTSSGSYLEDGGVWLYDTVIYGLVAASFGRGVLIERAAAVLLAVVLAIAGCQGSYQIWSEIVSADQMQCAALGLLHYHSQAEQVLKPRCYFAIATQVSL